MIKEWKNQVSLAGSWPKGSNRIRWNHNLWITQIYIQEDGMCEDDELSHFMMKSLDSGTQEVLSEPSFLHNPQHSSLSQWRGHLFSISGDPKYPSSWFKGSINTPFVPSWTLWHSPLSVLWSKRNESEKDIPSVHVLTIGQEELS